MKDEWWTVSRDAIAVSGTALAAGFVRRSGKLLAIHSRKP
jgi:hypothetical protein